MKKNLTLTFCLPVRKIFLQLKYNLPIKST